jgi:TolB-like protein/Flp pilus assembly protein TadD
MSLFTELKRRNVFRMAVLYLGAAWLVMQVVDLLIDRGPLPETLGPAILAVLAIGLPIALALSWFYEVTPEGVTLDEEVQRGASAPATGRAMDFVVIAVMAAALLLFAYDKWWTGPPPERSVAVLPFVNMSTDEDTGHLGTGIAETILNMLAQMPELHVASATSSFQSRLDGLSVPEIADLLGVATLLEGSVQRQGSRLRITAQLIDAESNAHLWSSNFDRDDTDIFKIQDEIAAAVTSALHIVMRDEVRQRIDRAGTDNLAAFEAYSQAIDNLRVHTIESFFQAVEQLQRAVELDSDFARAHALLGYIYLDEYFYSFMTASERRNRSRDAARTALRIAPGLSTALTILGNLTDDGDAKGEMYREAVANDPNDTIALRAYANYLFYQSQTDEGMELAERLTRLDPLDERNYILLAGQQRLQSMAHEALATLARGKEKIPQSVLLRDAEYWCYSALGDFSSMIRVKHETLAFDPKEWLNRWMIAVDYFNVGMPEEAARWFGRAAETAPEKDRDFFRLMLQTTLDLYHQRNDEEVFESLRIWVTERGGLGFHSLQLHPHYIFIEYGDRQGRLDDVLGTFEDLFPYLFMDSPDMDRNLHHTNIVGEALLRAGDRQRGEQLLKQVLESADRYILGARQAYLSALDYPLRALVALGDSDRALDEFRALNTAQRFLYGKLGLRFIMQNSPAWAPIRETPEYAALLEELDRNAAKHRKNLQAMDLPLR